jgi:hypothetical protein
MQVLRDPAAAAAISNSEVRTLVERRLAMLSEEEPYDPQVHGYFMLVEEGDTLDVMDKQLGFPILSNRFDGKRFGEPGFTPSHELVEEHTSCYEIVFVLSDDGYGVEIFIPKSVVVDAELLALCRRYALPAAEPTE